MKFYLVKHCYSAQIEAWSIIGFRFGYTGFGFAIWPSQWRKRPWWFPHLHITIWSHSACCDQYWIFKIQLGKRSVGYRTVGDATPDMYAYRNRGFSYHYAKAA